MPQNIEGQKLKGPGSAEPKSERLNTMRDIPTKTAFDKSELPPIADHGHEPPHNIELEQALLGALLIHPLAFERVGEVIRAVHFFDPVHQQIFHSISTFNAAGKLANPLTLKHLFEHAQPISPEMTIPQYLGRLAAEATTVANAVDYANGIVQLSICRTLMAVGQDLLVSAHDLSLDVSPYDLIEEAEKALFAVSEQGAQSLARSFDAPIDEAMVAADAAYRDHMNGIIKKNGLSTGLVDLDRRLTCGLEKGSLIVIAGRPSMGKTALATNIAFNIANQRRKDPTRGGIVHFYSMEMTSGQLVSRILSAHSGIPLSTVLAGSFSSDNEISNFLRSGSMIRSAPFHIDETGGLSIARLATRARRAKRRHGMDCIVVDYLQLMAGSKKSGDNRVQEVTEITTGLKSLAKELEVPIIALSQLSRKVEERTDKRPQLADLRESGSIEQDADIVMFVYRDEYYIERLKPNTGEHSREYLEWQTKLAAASGKAEVIISKQRQGPLGAVDVAWNGEMTLFSNLTDSRHQGGH